jgi:hypothetical protein
LITALALTAGCGGEDAPTDPGGGGDGGGGGGGGTPRVVKATPAFGADIQEVFDRIGCSTSGCHGTAQSAGLDLRSGNAYDNLVNVQALSERVVRVIPGDANGSYLVIKLEGRQTAGARMPLNGTALDNIDLTNIKNWINNGAPNN